MQVGYDQVRLADPGDLALDARDASELAATIAPLFAEAGYALGLASPDRWFFTAERSPGPSRGFVFSPYNQRSLTPRRGW